MTLDDVPGEYFYAAKSYSASAGRKCKKGGGIGMPKLPKLPKLPKKERPVDEYEDEKETEEFSLNSNTTTSASNLFIDDEEFEFDTQENEGRENGNNKIKLRNNFNALAHFTGAVLTDKQGKVSIPVQITDALTRFKVFAVVSAINNRNQYGKGESTITTQLPLLIRSAAPQFMYYNDESTISVLVENITNENKTVHLALVCKSKNIVVFTNEQVEVSNFGYSLDIQGNRSHWFTFTVKAVNLGDCQIEILCSSGNYGDGEFIEFPIYSINTTETMISGEITEENGIRISKLDPPRDCLPDFGEFRVQFSTKRITNLFRVVKNTLQSFLHSFEQRASYALILSSMSDVVQPFFNNPDLCKLYFDRFYNITSLIQSNRNFILNNAWYNRFHYMEEIYLFLALSVSKKLSNFKNSAFNKFKKNLESFSKTAWHQKRFAFSLFALWMHKPTHSIRKSVLNYLRNTFLHELSFETIALFLPILSDNHSLITIPSTAKIIAEWRENILNCLASNWFSVFEKENFILWRPSEYANDHLDSPTRLVSIILFGILSVAPTNFMVDPLVNLLFSRTRNGVWDTSHENGWAVFALRSYFKQFDKFADSTAFAWLNENFCGEYKMDKNNFSQKFAIPLEVLRKKEQKAEHDVILYKKGKANLFYELEIKFASTQLIVAPQSNGISIERTYSPHESNSLEHKVKYDNELWTVSKSSRVVVTLFIKIEKAVDNIVIVDYLPAGFEAENPKIKKLPPVIRNEASKSIEVVVESEDQVQFDDLPAEIIIQIFTYFSIKELAGFELVSKYWRKLASDSLIWNKFIKRIKNVDYDLREWWMSSKDFYLLLTNKITKDYCYENHQAEKQIKHEDDWFDHQNLRMERVECFASSVPRAGVYVYSYTARAARSGTFIAPPAKASLLYDPFIKCNSETLFVQVV